MTIETGAVSPGAHTRSDQSETPEHRLVNRIRVVIADDNEALRALVRVQLETNAEFEIVAEASDGLEALAVVEEQRPDLLLLDLAMPKIDGLGALERLRDSATGPRVVVFSGYTGPQVAAAARRLGAVDCLEKGLAAAELTAALRKACDR